jgi:hypothetical protein
MQRKYRHFLTYRLLQLRPNKLGQPGGIDYVERRKFDLVQGQGVCPVSPLRNRRDCRFATVPRFDWNRERKLGRLNFHVGELLLPVYHFSS